ncbi:MAG: hypothetical protein JSU07_03200, partial [Bacteroidetes bacterium]|nr:hypothetical protein [Bacteroidota bacterium]
NAQPNNALFINYFCGRNVSICENTSLAGGGGRVQVGNFFSAKKHVEIGDATYGISDTSNIASGINANAGKGIVLKTWNNGFPLISISNTNFPKSPFTLYGNGQTFIGVKKPNPTGPHANAMLSIDGKVLAKEIYVNINTATWADYVFDKSYKLLKLNEVEKYIIENKHLPNIPSEKELIKEGSLDINVAEMQKLQMQKIEELFLYVIDLKKEIEILKKENTNLKAKTK